MNDASESSDAFASARTFEWGGAVGEDGFTANEHAAYDALELDPGAGADAVKSQYRKLAKLYHPDANRGDPAAAERFHAIQMAYDLLKDKSA
ncbi:J domain-containing protein [Kordiimonas sp. A6E486]|nr:J domain-containing protein [Kordiimonas marina]